MPPPLERAAALGVTVRAMTDADLAFTAEVYASTRLEELASVAMPPDQQQAFLAMQHAAQHHHYRTHYDGAEWLAIERGGEGVGRLYLVEWAEEFRVIDIALLPAHRGSGIGAAILSDIIAAAGAAGKRVSIHVEKHNPAKRLYERLGFEVVLDRGVYDLLEWSPEAGSDQKKIAS